MKDNKQSHVNSYNTQLNINEPARIVKITFIKSGKTIVWESKYHSILEFAERHGIFLEHGCREGNCGTCETQISCGKVSYSSEPGITVEQGHCLICISIPHGSIELKA